MRLVAAHRLLLAFALVLAAATARADSVYLGGTYSGTLSMIVDGSPIGEGGGNIGGSSGVVGGQSFNFLALYCVDQFTGASLNTNYSATYNTTGTINGQALPAAGKIAWLMLNIAPTLSSQAQYQALQGLIWQLESPTGGHTVSFDTGSGNSAAAISYFNSYVAALGNNTAPASSVWWINPTNAQGQYAYQGFVGITQSQRDSVPVPEPASALLLGLGLAALAAARKRARA